MKNEQFFDVLGDIDDKFIAEARRNSGKLTYVRRVVRKTAVACAAVLALVGVIWGMNSYIETRRLKSSDNTDADSALSLFTWNEGKNQAPRLVVIEYSGAYYEAMNMSNCKSLDKYNLPHKITEEMVGERVAELSSDSGEHFTFYRYAPYDGVNQKAVYVASNDNFYTFAIFCNYARIDTSLYDTAQEMFAIMGVYCAEDISCVEIGNSVLSSREDIERFYDLLCGAEAMGEDGYQRSVFSGMTELRQQEFCTELADTAMEIRITARHGFRECMLMYEPKINYVRWSINHYKLSEPLI